MDDPNVPVDAKYEERVRIKHLSMKPSLQGAKALFEFETHRIKIALPKLSPEHQRKLGDPYAEAEADVWKNGRIADIYIYFLSVAVLDLHFELPAAAAKHPHINMTLYPENQLQELDEKSDRLYYLARRAVDYFLRVVRWKTGFGLIALDARPDRETLFDGRLYNLSHGGAFYSPRVGRTAVAPKRHRLNVQEWKKIESAIGAGTQPPIWNEFLMSAQRRIDMNDLRAGTIDLAIAAESVIRQYPAISVTKRKATISKLLADWNQLGFPAVSDLPWFRRLKPLFHVRNEIMHRGNDQHVEISFCRDATIAVENLIIALGS